MEIFFEILHKKSIFQMIVNKWIIVLYFICNLKNDIKTQASASKHILHYNNQPIIFFHTVRV